MLGINVRRPVTQTCIVVGMNPTEGVNGPHHAVLLSLVTYFKATLLHAATVFCIGCVQKNFLCVCGIDWGKSTEGHRFYLGIARKESIGRSSTSSHFHLSTNLFGAKLILLAYKSVSKLSTDNLGLMFFLGLTQQNGPKVLSFKSNVNSNIIERVMVESC